VEPAKYSKTAAPDKIRGGCAFDAVFPEGTAKWMSKAQLCDKSFF
jgi:hypothetical protein